jgi:hypothetical protein
MNLVRRLLLGPGRLPDDLHAALVAEEPALLLEELAGSVAYRGYRAPGRSAGLEKQALSGAIAITPRRLVAWTGGSEQLDVPLSDPRWRRIDVVAQSPTKVCFGYDPAFFDPATSGRVELRFRTPRAADVVATLARLRSGAGEMP